MASGKKYTPLLDLPGTPVERCSQILANKLQCWRAGDFLVEEEAAPKPQTPPVGAPVSNAPKFQTPSPAQAPVPSPEKEKEAAAPAAKADAPKGYQLCSMHATINKRAEAADAANPPKTGERSSLEKMLGVEMRYRNTVPPHAVEELRREEVKTQAEKDYDKMMAEPEQAKAKEEQPKAETVGKK